MAVTGSFPRRFWRLAGGYWTGREQRPVRWLTAVLVLLTIAQVVVPVMLNWWSQTLFDALEQKDLRRLLPVAGTLGLIILGNMTVTTVHLGVKRRIQLDWRRWLTRRVVESWMVDGRHYQVTHLPGEHDNPDGRIAEDVRISTEYALDLAHSLVYCLLLLVSFTKILWTLSGPLHLPVDGLELTIPGHLVWVALAYAAIGTTVALTLGRPLIRAVNTRQTGEADFRFGLAHAREFAETIALLHGERGERRRFLGLFQRLAAAWNAQTRALIHIFLFTSSWSVLSTAFPVLIAAPRYMAGAITLGVLMQTAQAFQQMDSALSWPIDNLAKVAEWRASVERVLSLLAPLQTLAALPSEGAAAAIRMVPAGRPLLAFHRLCLANPDGQPILQDFSGEVHAGERVLIAGEPTAALKLFKAVAGVWPWGDGRIETPDAAIFFMTQRPYLPLGSLREALCSPAAAEAFSPAALASALGRVGLGGLAGRLDESGHWDETLTAGEQQRLGFARMLLHRPDWIFLEDATNALDSEGEEAMMRLLRHELPQATLLTVSARPQMEAYHLRKLVLQPTAGHPLVVVERPLVRPPPPS